jgi:hypothetical protein
MLTLLLADVRATTADPANATARAPQHEAAPAQPTHGEIEVGANVAGGASTWSGDPVGYGGLTLGFRLFRVVTPYVGGALGYGGVDERLLTRLTFGLSVGVTIAERFRPYAFGAFVHQHEESLAAVAEQPFGAVLGIGNGIRHRAGTHFGVGFEFVLLRRPNLDFTVAPELSAMYLTYSSGPDWYFVGGATARFHYRLF